MYPSEASTDDDDPSLHSLPEHQRTAALSPHTSLRDLVGNFSDMQSLFDRLGEVNLIELGKPLPRKRFLPKKRAGRCAEAHNSGLSAD